VQSVPHSALVRWLRGEASLPITLLHLLSSFSDADALLCHLDSSRERVVGDEVGAARLAALRQFAQAHRPGIALVRQMGALHARAEAELPERGVDTLRELYDRLADLDPSAAVALYAFGDARILDEATHEVISYLVDRGILSPSRRLLELGCGIGRLLEACAARCASTVGVDVSPRMVELASARVRHIPNAAAQLGNGGDLAAFATASVDVVLAADSWPHVVMLGADTMIGLAREVARVLVPGGEFVVLNFSYREGEGRDLADVRRLVSLLPFEIVEQALRPFRLWDAVTWRLRRGVG
jgi:SAM-dependent methyltransferase